MPTAIANKVQQLLAANFNLGAKISNEVAIPYGGQMQEFEEANLYYHSVMGTSAHEVHGAIRTKYLSLGGYDVDSRSGNRLLGFPLSDEQNSLDGLCLMSKFEWGAIYSIFGVVVIYGKIYEEYLRLGAETSSYGYPLADPVKISGGDVVYFEFGCMYCGSKSNNQVIAIKHKLPQLGHPWMINQAEIEKEVVAEFTFYKNIMNRSNAGGLFEEIYNRRFYLKLTGSTEVVPLTFESSDAKEHPLSEHIHLFDSNMQLMGNPVLRDRKLYDIIIKLPNGRTHNIAPHSLYIKKDWKDFKFMHATDLHISRRLDGWRKFFKDKSMDDAVRNFNNFNDNFRELIKFANKLHMSGNLDFIMITGDLVDYVYEDGAKRHSNNNFVYLENIIRGMTGKPDQVEDEELSVPIITSLGNHDYRIRPYYPYFTVDIPISPDRTFEQYSSFNLTKDEAKVLTEHILPGSKVSSSVAFSMVRPDIENRNGNLNYYSRHICRETSYKILLGKNQVIMIDGKWDDSPIDDSIDALEFKLGFKGEATENFAAGSPDSVGFTGSEIEMVTKALNREQGLVIVGVHAPLINPKSSEYSYFLRSSIRLKNTEPFKNEMRKYLFRRSPISFSVITNGYDLTRDVHSGWQRGSTFHFHQGDGSDLLDQGVMRGNQEAFLKLCVNAENNLGPVDLVLSGHVHKNWECIARWNNIDKNIYFQHDFYTENPNVYYHSYDNDINAEERFYWYPNQGNIVEKTLRKIHVRVTNEAEVDEKPKEGSSGVWSIRTKPNHPTLNSLEEGLGDALFWAASRPLLIQTAALGPSEFLRDPEKQPDFRGCRLISVKSDSIENIRYVTKASIKIFLSRGPNSNNLDDILSRELAH